MDEKTFIEPSPDEWFQEQQEKKKSLLQWLSISALLRLFTMSAYMAYRLCCMILTQKRLTRTDLAAAWIFFAIESSFAVARIPPIWRSLSAMGAVRIRPAIYLQGPKVPTVDIFIPTCGEDLKIILDTVRAACNIDYPRDKYRVIVLDDGNSPACKRSIESLRKEYPSLRYTARGALVKTHSKAANLNHGLDFVSQEGASEMIAVLDVDMIPEPNWLRSLLPHIVQDPDVALANPPQCFYDLPKHDPVSNLSAACHMCNVAATQQDFTNEAWCNGSGFVVRRKAINQIGGFPTQCLLEDMLTSMRLQLAGWKCVLVLEPLQWGSVPDSFAKNVKQVQRWTAGSLTIANAIQDERAIQTGAWLVEVSVAMTIWKSFLCFTVMPILLLLGGNLILYGNPQQLRILLSLAYLDFTAHALQGFLESGIADFCISILQDFAHLWLSPYLFPDLFRWLFPWASFWCCPNFKPSGCAMGAEETDQYQSSLLRRFKVMMWDSYALLHVVVFCACLSGVVASLSNTFKYTGRKNLYWLSHAGYPPALLLWTSVISNAWVPIYYAIWTPHRPDRETLLYRDPGSQVAYPTASAKSQDHRKSKEIQFMIVLTYYCGILLGSWWF